MHGSGRTKSAEAQFSNNPKSFLSSLGKYVIAKEKYRSSNYGYCYKLYGKDTTNSNAERRKVVLHPSKYVPSKEVYPKRIGKSRGCPAVSQGAFNFLDRKLKNTDKNVLLWIVN